MGNHKWKLVKNIIDGKVLFSGEIILSNQTRVTTPAVAVGEDGDELAAVGSLSRLAETLEHPLLEW